MGLEGSKSNLPIPTRWSTRQARLLLAGFAWRTRANGHNVNQERVRFSPQGQPDVETSCPNRVMHSLSLELCKPQLNKALSNLILSPWQPHVKEEVGLQAFWDPFQPEKSYDFRIHIFLMYFYTCWVNHSYSKTPASKESQCISAKVCTHSWI